MKEQFSLGNEEKPVYIFEELPASASQGMQLCSYSSHVCPCEGMQDLHLLQSFCTDLQGILETNCLTFRFRSSSLNTVSVLLLML